MEFGIGSFATLFIGFISSPIITRLISPEENGKFSMFITIGNLLMLIMMLGLDQAFVRFFYDEIEENRIALFKRCIIIPLFISIFSSLIMLFLYKPISSYIIGKVSFLIVILLGIYLTTSVIFRFLMLQIRMMQKAKLYSLINIIQKVINLIVIMLIFTIEGNSYITLIGGTIIALFISIIIAIISEWDIFLKWNISNKMETKTKELLRYGMPLIFSMAITWIFQSVDRIIIKGFVGYSELGLYNGAMTIISLLNAAQNTFTIFWIPVSFERYSNNPNDKNFFKNTNEIVAMFMLLIAVLLIASKDIIIYLLGSQYRDSVYIFPFLVFMPIMYTISETTVLGINFKKKSKEHIKIASIAAIFNIIGNIILVPIFGAKGAAISTGIAYVIFFGARTYISNKYYKVDYNITKFMLLIGMIYILAIYSSFNSFNIIIFIMSLTIVITIIIIYRNIVGLIFKNIKLFINNKIKS
ncbi:lipopolysaccharide biosynthesis protein [Clostridium perfringens]